MKIRFPKHLYLIRTAILLCVGLGLLGLTFQVIFADAEAGHAALIDIDDILMPVTNDFLERAIDVADKDSAQILIIRLDTPGGSLDVTREMVEAIGSARIPIVVFVAPSGAHAASAGTFLTAWAHLAVMAPTTSIGAATPVGSTGQELPETVGAKATEDALSLFRGIAESRNRNAEALESTVTDSKSFSSTEALNQGIIDFIADDLDDLISKLDGRSITLQGSTVVLDTYGIEVLQIRRTVLEDFLVFLADPNVFFLLLIIGGIGVLVEIVVPGLIAPGVGGAILLLLAFVAAGNLPVNLVGVALLALAILLFYLELQAVGVGVAGVGGGICFVLGALLLFGGFAPPGILGGSPDLPTPSTKVNIWLLVGVGFSILGLLWFVLRQLVEAKRVGESIRNTLQPLVGGIGITTTDLSPHGTVHLDGESWSGFSDDDHPIPKGADVKVTKTEGLVLHVTQVLHVGEFRDSRY
ncbi:MAG: nodulation protein NfeD, partial [SAR202 cluster bacterium]|nr:nodulation protein NfeD [SAR202 cluster bacterium]